MNLLISIAVIWVAILSATTGMYWLSGASFERCPEIAIVYTLASLFGGMLSWATFAIFQDNY